MNNVGAFCSLHFGEAEKKSLFFHRNLRICLNCNRPKVKTKKILNYFSSNHLQMICTCQNEVHHAGGGLRAGVVHGDVEGQGIGHGMGNRQFVTIAQFNAFGNIVDLNFNNVYNRLNLLDANMLNISNNLNNLTLQVNNLTNNIDNLTNNINNLTNKVDNLTNNVKVLKDKVDDLTDTVHDLNDTVGELKDELAFKTRRIK